MLDIHDIQNYKSTAAHQFERLIVEDDKQRHFTQPRCSCGWQGEYDANGPAFDRLAWAEHVEESLDDYLPAVDTAQEMAWEDNNARSLGLFND
jgi:hypothetical protein